MSWLWYLLERIEYALEIALRLLDKMRDGASRKACQMRAGALHALRDETEERLDAGRQEMDWRDAMVAEMQAGLGIDPVEGFCGGGEDQDLAF